MFCSPLYYRLNLTSIYNYLLQRFREMGIQNRRILFYIITHGWGHRTFIPRHQYPAHIHPSEYAYPILGFGGRRIVDDPAVYI